MRRHKLLVTITTMVLCGGLIGLASSGDQPPPTPKPAKPVGDPQTVGATIQGTIDWPDPVEGRPVPGYEAGCSKIRIVVKGVPATMRVPGGEMYVAGSNLKEVWATPKGNQCAYTLEGLPSRGTFQLEATYEGQWSIAGKYLSVVELVRLKTGGNVTKDLKLGVGSIPK